ncbi:HlyD family efflux transporter periplasmic adaptor subunit [Rubrivirga sp. S365]|uniref:HlyD family efflux transporter periplasmic adaptor subunit n=1 Tax=Rubrivirga litoralis TaxID=3075598 RepID=A0ABU3BTC6_9BACT|nr:MULTISPECIES: HlyD family efflux transporter periplasmic adaptor subunit [unclassified Rubrivirga]MDT0632549.1 HlyD family efflux transporter periplasmic adaptor subunit [Rubrivirga sp. F394]MDT7856765.1 HlyD family efflux transporter periplasmic adaptor subunit [Rubrivirga sp. S365]
MSAPITLPPTPNGAADADRPAPPASVLTRPVGGAVSGGAAPGGAAGHGEGVDRRRAKRLVTPRRALAALAVLAVSALAAWALWGRPEGQTLRVDADRLTVAAVEDGPFQEYVAVTGTAQPLRTVLLDAVEGGQVVRRHVEEGDTVAAGQVLFTLRNDDLALEVMGSESQLEEQAAALRQNRLQMDQSALDLEQQLAQLDYDITRLERDEARVSGLVDRDAAPRKDLLAIQDELAYTRRRRALTARGAEQQEAQHRVQTRDMAASVGRLRENLALVRRSSTNLTVRAPVAGQVSGLQAEIGELKNRGDRLGQVDVLDASKVRALIDEHYLPRVAPGQRATATVGGAEYTLAVRAVYPEVTDGRFEAELVFAGPAPPDLRRGQSVRLRLELGDPERARLLERGGFYGDTGGQWVFVLSPDGREAVRRPVELGRQTPRHFEVLGGLERGDRVVVSSYAAFGDADRLVVE